MTNSQLTPDSVAYALTIAGSEATGGAGAQADLKTFQQLGVFGLTTLTCIVSFDPKNNWDHRFVPIEPQVIADQFEAGTATYPISTVKIGMLGTPQTIATVSDLLEGQNLSNIVLDPVLICKGQEPGHALDTDEALKAKILPKATFITPNHFESLTLSGLDEITNVEQLSEAAKRIHDTSGAAVLAKGGVRLAGDDAVDVFYDGETLEVLSAPKVSDVAVSGAGCTLAAAVTALLALGRSPLEAAHEAKRFVTAGIVARVQANTPFDVVRQVSPE